LFGSSEGERAVDDLDAKVSAYDDVTAKLIDQVC
jgi:hypothetical protein